MERMIIDVILQCSTIAGACQIMRVTWDEAFGVMQRGVMRGQQRKPATVVKQIGVDEKAFRKGHRYMTVVCDLERATVEHVADDRTTQSLAGYYASLTAEQRLGIGRN
jgi:transposase